jgi:hypothetical protein
MLPNVGLTKTYLKMAVIQGGEVFSKFPRSKANSKQAAKYAAINTAYQVLCAQYPQALEVFDA